MSINAKLEQFGISARGTELNFGFDSFTNKDGDPIVLDPQDAEASLGAMTAAAAVGANPTKAEFDLLLDDVTANRNKLNAILVKLRSAGVIAE